MHAIELKRGLWFVRASATCVGLCGWFVTADLMACPPGFIGSKSFIYAALMEYFATSCIPGAAGLFMAILLKAGHDALMNQAEELIQDLSIAAPARALPSPRPGRSAVS